LKTLQNKKIKVLHIIKSLGRGGAEMLLPETLKLHNHKHFEFHYIYFLPWKNQLVENLMQHGGNVYCVHARNNLQILNRVKDVVSYIEQKEIQIIHAHLPWAGVLARRVGKKTGLPVLYTEHNKQERYHFATRWINLFTMNQLSGLIAVSEDVAQSVRTHKKRLKIPIYTILNGVNGMYFKSGMIESTIREQLNIPPLAPVVGTVAVFRFQKRLDVWLESAARIVEKNPEVRFIVVGDGPLRLKLLEKCKSLGLNDKVYFTGLQTEIRPYLAAMDVYMMSSVFEGLPIALLEAMAFSLPVATTNAGGIRQVIRNGIEGLMCDVDQPEKLANMVLQLLDDENLRKEMGDRARLRILKSFSLDRMVEQLEVLYETLTDNGESLIEDSDNMKTNIKK
jgi:glycosyltransferase involved in cell wall biosynthesis